MMYFLIAFINSRTLELDFSIVVVSLPCAESLKSILLSVSPDLLSIWPSWRSISLITTIDWVSSPPKYSDISSMLIEVGALGLYKEMEETSAVATCVSLLPTSKILLKRSALRFVW